VGSKLCNPVTDSCNVLGAWHLAPILRPTWAPIWTLTWASHDVVVCVLACSRSRVLPMLVDIRTLHGTSSFGELNLPCFREDHA
jgi:hypothetical protein